jgi:hypothetical protein
LLQTASELMPAKTNNGIEAEISRLITGKKRKFEVVRVAGNDQIEQIKKDSSDEESWNMDLLYSRAVFE